MYKAVPFVRCAVHSTLYLVPCTLYIVLIISTLVLSTRYDVHRTSTSYPRSTGVHRVALQLNTARHSTIHRTLYKVACTYIQNKPVWVQKCEQMNTHFFWRERERDTRERERERERRWEGDGRAYIYTCICARMYIVHVRTCARAACAAG